METHGFFAKQDWRKIKEEDFLEALQEANKNMTKNVPATDANICINDLRTNKEDKSEYKVVKVEKEPFYNEFEKMERLKKMVKEIGNDQELGEMVRREFS